MERRLLQPDLDPCVDVGPQTFAIARSCIFKSFSGAFECRRLNRIAGVIDDAVVVDLAGTTKLDEKVLHLVVALLFLGEDAAHFHLVVDLPHGRRPKLIDDIDDRFAPFVHLSGRRLGTGRLRNGTLNTEPQGTTGRAALT